LFRLCCCKEHLFVEIGGARWLLDTGAPTSFGSMSPLAIAGEELRLVDGYLGMTASTLSRSLLVECAGLLGADVLGRFDLLLDVPGGSAEVSTEELNHPSQPVPMDEFMGIPIISVQVDGEECRMFFDTGAQLSYFQSDRLRAFPSAGIFTDFYPGIGHFQTETHTATIDIGAVQFNFRGGVLPGLLGATLAVAGVEGIIGNQVLRDRRIGYFPRRRMLVL